MRAVKLEHLPNVRRVFKDQSCMGASHAYRKLLCALVFVSPCGNVVLLPLGLFSHDPLGLASVRVVIPALLPRSSLNGKEASWGRLVSSASHFSGQWAGKRKLGGKQRCFIK